MSIWLGFILLSSMKIIQHRIFVMYKYSYADCSTAVYKINVNKLSSGLSAIRQWLPLLSYLWGLIQWQPLLSYLCNLWPASNASLEQYKCCTRFNLNFSNKIIAIIVQYQKYKLKRLQTEMEALLEQCH